MVVQGMISAKQQAIQPTNAILETEGTMFVCAVPIGHQLCLVWRACLKQLAVVRPRLRTGVLPIIVEKLAQRRTYGMYVSLLLGRVIFAFAMHQAGPPQRIVCHVCLRAILVTITLVRPAPTQLTYVH